MLNYPFKKKTCCLRPASPELCLTRRRTLSLTRRPPSRTPAARRRARPRWRERTWEVGGPSTVPPTQVWDPLDSLYRHAHGHLHITLGDWRCLLGLIFLFLWFSSLHSKLVLLSFGLWLLVFLFHLTSPDTVNLKHGGIYIGSLGFIQPIKGISFI